MSSVRWSDPWVTRLLLAYAFALPFVRLVTLPYVDAKLQPTEAIFLLLLPVAVYRYRAELLRQPRAWLFALGFYVAVNLAAAVGSGHLPALLEGVGRCYLALLAVIVATYVRSHPTGWRRLVRAFYYGAAVSALVALAGYALALAGRWTPTVLVYENYPYFGTLYRAAGFAGGANTLVYVSFLPALYAYRCWRTGGPFPGLLPFILLACALTFSKDLLLLGLGLFLVEPLTARLARPGRVALVAATALTLWFMTHYIVQPRGADAGAVLSGTPYTSERVVWRGGGVQLLETSYTALKQAGVAVGAAHPWLGVGPGHFNAYLPALKAAGRYPTHLPDYDPHSTWTGTFAETGALGALALFLLLGWWLTHTGGVNFLPAHLAPEDLGLRVFVLLLLIAAFSVDAMNFRYLWMGLGAAVGLAHQKQTPPSVA